MAVLVVDGIAKIYLREGVVVASDKTGNRMEQTIPDLELVVVIGRRVLATSALLLTLATNNIPVVFVDPHGGVVATLLETVQVGSTSIREAQYTCINTLDCRLKVARKIIEAKLRGFYNLVKYELKYHPELAAKLQSPHTSLDYLKSRILASIEDAGKASSIDELRNIEALGSQAAWSIIARLFPEKYQFTGRKPRGGDVVNTAIDFTYAVLYAILYKAIVANGLDPYAGLIHTDKPGRKSLAYDLSEIYKPLAVHAVLQASRIHELKTHHATQKLTPKTIEALIKQLYHKLHTLGEKYYKRKNIWIHPIKEAEKLKKTFTRNEPYKPYTYTL